MLLPPYISKKKHIKKKKRGSSGRIPIQWKGDKERKIKIIKKRRVLGHGKSEKI